MKVTTSSDGTKRIDFDESYSSVIIPTVNDKYAVCVSSQVGCAMGCKFCYSGKIKFKKNLNADEIVNQVKIAKDIMNEATDKASKNPYSVVFMGMGEPMLNFGDVVNAMERIHKEFQVRYRRITISTSGINLDKLLNVPCNVAISLHSAFDEKRKKLMPNNKLKIKNILDFAKKYCKLHPKHELMIEYALIKGINDTDADMKKLFSFKWPKNTNFNFIEFNDIGKFRKSSRERLFEFKNKAISKGWKSFVRYSRGADIKAACGMLSAQGY